MKIKQQNSYTSAITICRGWIGRILGGLSPSLSTYESYYYIHTLILK